MLSILRNMADSIWLRVAWKKTKLRTVNNCVDQPTLAVVWLIMFLLAR